MSNVSIYGKNWIDLVFEGKNKEYGAYQLRQENSRTTLMALFIGVAFFAGIAGTGMLISSFTSADVIDNPPIPLDPKIHVTEVTFPDLTKIEKPKTTVPQNAKEPINLSHMVVARQEEAKTDIPTNEDAKKQQPTGQTSPEGTGTVGSPIEGKTITTVVTTTDTKKLNTTNELDRMPEFPGGIKEFQKYIGKNIDRPEIDENVGSVTAIVSFVIETDGSLSDIKVLRSNDKDLERAAIKVLRSLRTKWTPGVKDGQYVRTLYIQPIRVAL